MSSRLASLARSRWFKIAFCLKMVFTLTLGLQFLPAHVLAARAKTVPAASCVVPETSESVNMCPVLPEPRECGNE